MSTKKNTRAFGFILGLPFHMAAKLAAMLVSGVKVVDKSVDSYTTTYQKMHMHRKLYEEEQQRQQVEEILDLHELGRD